MRPSVRRVSWSADFQSANSCKSGEPLRARMPALPLKEMEQHALTTKDEVCGFVYQNHYVPLPNVSGEPYRFYGDPSTVVRNLFLYGEPVAIFHTHPNGCLELSVEDRRMWYYSNSTMIVGCVRDGQLRWKMYGKPGD